MLTVNLFVLPYNYPMLLPLLDDLFKVHRLKPGVEWRTQFHNYLRTMPPYYAGIFITFNLNCQRLKPGFRDYSVHIIGVDGGRGGDLTTPHFTCSGILSQLFLFL